MYRFRKFSAPSFLDSVHWFFVFVFYCFTSRSRIFHLLSVKWLQNFGVCSALRAFEHGGIFIVPHLLWHRATVFPVSSEGLPHSVASYDTQGDVENLFLPESSRVLGLWVENFLENNKKFYEIGAWPFIWTNLNFLYLRIISTKLDGIWPSEDLKKIQCVFTLSILRALYHLYKLESPPPKYDLCRVWLKLAQWFWRRSRICKSL
jgi:hypothetical protein